MFKIFEMTLINVIYQTFQLFPFMYTVNCIMQYIHIAIPLAQPEPVHCYMVPLVYERWGSPFYKDIFILAFPLLWAVIVTVITNVLISFSGAAELIEICSRCWTRFLLYALNYCCFKCSWNNNKYSLLGDIQYT